MRNNGVVKELDKEEKLGATKMAVSLSLLPCGSIMYGSKFSDILLSSFGYRTRFKI